jgi:peptidoglycan/LPS O-acetylase OafA/YrhL
VVLLLELARGFACLWIFFFHLNALEAVFETSSPFLANFASYGHLGVPMFFVISGYAITHAAESSRKANKSPLIFLKNRFRRIYPTFWVSLVAVLILPYGLEFISNLKTGHYVQPENIISQFDTWEWFNVLLLTKVFWATSSNLAAEFAAINSLYWTLAIEFQLYLVVFLALCLGRFYRHAIALVSAVAILLIFIPNNVSFGLFIHYWPSFAVGIALAYLHRNELKFRIDSPKKSALLFVLTCVAIGIAYLAPAIKISTNFLVFASIFGAGLWFFADLEILLRRWKNSESRVSFFLLQPWLVLGTMSYSAYLLHLKLYLLPFMFVRQIFDADNPALGLITIFSTLVISYPFYYFVERNFLSKNYKKLHQDLIAPTPEVSHKKSAAS